MQAFCKILPTLTVPVRQPRAGAVSLRQRKSADLGRVLNRQDACPSIYLEVGFFKFTVNLLLNSMGGHAHETCLRVAGFDGFADLESPTPPVHIYLPKVNSTPLRFICNFESPREKAGHKNRVRAVQNRTAFEISE